jgi:peptide/nickel transport system substrate-binding protein
MLVVASAGVAQEILRCGVWQPHQQFNPFFKGTGNEVLEGVWERLLDLDLATGAITGELAESFELEGSTVHVKLHEGVLFHDGKELTAQLVADVVEMCRDPGLGRNMTYPVSLIESTTVTGTYTIDLEIIDSVTSLYALEVLTYLVIGDPSMAPFDSVDKANGTGAFKVESERPGAELVLVKN